MKKYLLLFICSLFLIGTGCNEKKSSGKKVTVKRDVPKASPIPPPNNAATAATPSIATTAVQHYICSNNCVGSGGPAAGNCPVCNSAYVHNAAYHNQPQQSQPATPNPFGAAPALGAPSTPTGATNAAGVYHYTCSNGCAGGSGAAGNCANCGNALAHNAAYHN